MTVLVFMLGRIHPAAEPTVELDQVAQAEPSTAMAMEDG